MEGAPWDPVLAPARGLIAPLRPEEWAPHEAATLALAGVLVLLIALKAFRDVGLTTFETMSILLLAPLVAHLEAPLWDPTPNATLAMNLAGFFVPLAVSLKMLAEGRAPFLLTMLALTITTGVAYASSYAVPNEGVLLYYRVPALAAAAVALLAARTAWHRVGPTAYVAGAGGVIIGADALRVHELLVTPEPHRIVIGGAGVLDGIFLVGILAVVLAAFGAACATAARDLVAPTRGPGEGAGGSPPEQRGNRTPLRGEVGGLD